MGSEGPSSFEPLQIVSGPRDPNLRGLLKDTTNRVDSVHPAHYNNWAAGTMVFSMRKDDDGKKVMKLVTQHSHFKSPKAQLKETMNYPQVHEVPQKVADKVLSGWRKQALGEVIHVSQDYDNIPIIIPDQHFRAGIGESIKGTHLEREISALCKEMNLKNPEITSDGGWEEIHIDTKPKER